MSQELIQIVDERDRPLRAGTVEEAWQKGLFYRVARIMIESTDGGLVLVQRHSPEKVLYGNRWDNSVAGKGGVGETYLNTANRKAREELGVFGLALEQVAYYRSEGVFRTLFLCEFNTLYRARLDPSTPLQLAEGEVAAAHWLPRQELQESVAYHPDQCTPGLERAVELLYQEG